MGRKLSSYPKTYRPPANLLGHIPPTYTWRIEYEDAVGDLWRNGKCVSAKVSYVTEAVLLREGWELDRG